MTKPLFTKLHTAAQDIRLSDTERDSMRAALRAHMQVASAPVGLTKSPYSFLYMPRFAAFLVVPLLVVMSAGTSFAASGALPGDLLYPVKISVNEQVESALAFTPTAKAQMHVSLAGKRLEEAQMLAMSGKLDASTTAEIQSNFEVHANEAKALSKSVAVVDPSAAAEISTQLTSSLAANNAVLEDVGNNSKDEKTRTDAHELADAVRQHVGGDTAGEGTRAKGARTTAALAPATFAVTAPTAGSTTLSSTTAHSASSTASSSQKKKVPGDATAALRVGNKAAGELSQAVQLFKDTSASLDSDTALGVQGQLSLLQHRLDHANTALSNGDTGSALQEFTATYASIIRLETLLKAAKRLGGKALEPLLRQPVSLNTPVGSVLGTSTEASSTVTISNTSTSSTVASSTSSTTVKAVKKEIKKKNHDPVSDHSFIKNVLEAIGQ